MREVVRDGGQQGHQDCCEVSGVSEGVGAVTEGGSACGSERGPLGCRTERYRAFALCFIPNC